METDPRSRMITTMSELLQTQGYQASGLNQLLSESDAPRGSLYHYFPGGKAEIAAAAIRLSGAGAASATTGAFESSESPEQALEAILDWLTRALEQSNYRYGCPIATTTLEMTSESIVIQEACRDAYSGWQSAISTPLVSSGMVQEEADSLATTILSAVEGALILCRAERSTRPLTTIANHLTALLHPTE